ncbi:MAG: DUF5615 family PIN-like protein [Hyphomicrobiales bacterium]
MAVFLIDAQLPPGLAGNLLERGHDAVHVNDIGLGNASDGRIADAARHRNAILVTKDEDFIVRSNLGMLECPIIWIRFGNTTNRAPWIRFEPVLPEVLAAIASGERIVEVG